MKLKEGVKLIGLKPEMILGIMIIDSVYNEFGSELVLTSITDGKHGYGSLHFSGNAVDCRIWDFKGEDLKRLVARLNEKLGGEFDVVQERDHIHVEFQPKNKKYYEYS